MPGVLAGGLDAVVATDAVSRDVDMVKLCREPGGRLVAVAALIAGGNVVRRLAGRYDAVMAGSAASHDGRMVHEGNRAPRGRGVTVRANVRRRDMIARLARCLHGALLRVAANAYRDCTLELATRVAALAVDAGVRAIQHEACAEVVERLLRDAV